MRIKNLCVLIHIEINGKIETVGPVAALMAVQITNSTRDLCDSYVYPCVGQSHSSHACEKCDWPTQG